MCKEKILDKIKKLLALGDVEKSKTTQQEAEAAMSAAFKLMAENNISHSELEEEEFIEFELDEYGNRPAELVYVGSILMSYFFVRLIEVKRVRTSRYTYRRSMVVIGSRENVEVAKYVMSYLTRVYKSLWKEYTVVWKRVLDSLEESDWRGYSNWTTEGSENEKILKSLGFPGDSKVVDQKRKVDYYTGLTTGIQDKLERERRIIFRGEYGENALIVTKQKLDIYYKDRFKNTKNIKNKEVKSNEAAQAGYAASKDVNIRRGLEGSGYSPKALEG